MTNLRRVIPTLILSVVLKLSTLYGETNGQCSGAGEIVTFEKVTGMTPRGVNPTPMFGRGSRGEVDDEPVTVQCSALCRNSQSCAAFLVRYGDGTCHSLTVDKLTDDLVTSHDKVNYFEKVCLPPIIGCERSWQYERVPGRELAGYDDKIIPNVLDRRLCQVLCTQERTFICRSGEYDYTLQQCRLSSEHRRSQPSAFRPAPSDVDYFENLCAPGPSAGCEYEELEGVDLGRADLLRSAFSAAQCRALCDAARPFLCRSASFWAGSGQCWLSGDDTSSAGARSLATRPGVFFYQRSNCLKVQLACNADSMTLTLNTLEPFVGRIFAKTQANLCNVEGKGQKSTSLIMPLKPTDVCGVQMESSGRYRNAVIVQHHPVIQRKGDRILQLLCVFETANRTVTSDYRVVIGDFSSATAIVNATAPSPNIRLRITDKNGDDITGTRLGEELYLRIEIDDDSVFGIAARDLIARSGKTDDYITLIDSNGCPTDPAIFPALQRVPGGKALQGRFDAFKFADDVVVRFEVNVQFCLQTCDPVACVNGGPSFGKRRRSVMEDFVGTDLLKENSTETPLLPDYSLQREIIVEGISVTPIKDSSIDRSSVVNYEEGLLCTSKPVIIGTVVVAVVVQLIIIVVCGVCVFIARKKRKEDEMDDGTLSTMTRMTSPFGNFGSDYRGTMRSLRRLD